MRPCQFFRILEWPVEAFCDSRKNGALSDRGFITDKSADPNTSAVWKIWYSIWGTEPNPEDCVMRIIDAKYTSYSYKPILQTFFHIKHDRLLECRFHSHRAPLCLLHNSYASCFAGEIKKFLMWELKLNSCNSKCCRRLMIWDFNRFVCRCLFHSSW